MAIEPAQNVLFAYPRAQLSLNVVFLSLSFSGEYKTRSVCENEELKLHCHESKFLNIYSASYGRSAHEVHFCSTKMNHLPQYGRLTKFKGELFIPEFKYYNFCFYPIGKKMICLS